MAPAPGRDMPPPPEPGISRNRLTSPELGRPPPGRTSPPGRTFGRFATSPAPGRAPAPPPGLAPGVGRLPMLGRLTFGRFPDATLPPDGRLISGRCAGRDMAGRRAPALNPPPPPPPPPLAPPPPPPARAPPPPPKPPPPRPPRAQTSAETQAPAANTQIKMNV